MRRQRAFILILCLMIAVLLLVMGMGFLGKRSSQYRGSRLSAPALQAQALAEAGLEDARVKLLKDQDFPPEGADDQTVFSYTERLTDLSGNPVGLYTVTVQTRDRDLPVGIIDIQSAGTVLDENGRPVAHRVLAAELDVAPTDRLSGGPNANLYRYLNFQDRGGI